MAGMNPWGGQPICVWITGTDVAGGSQVQVMNWPASQAVTGTFWPVTQPVSGTFWQATQPISGTVGVSGNVAVTGTFFQATQPVSAATLPLPSGASTESTLATFSAKVTTCNTGAVTIVASALPTGAATDATVAALTKPSTLCVTATAAVNTSVTATLPAAPGLFHYITNIQITKLYSVIGVASGSGNIVTTTNIPGSLAFTTEQLASAAGTAVKVVDLNLTGNPLKSSVVNTNTTIVCPQQLQTIWRIVVTYYTAA